MDSTSYEQLQGSDAPLRQGSDAPRESTRPFWDGRSMTSLNMILGGIHSVVERMDFVLWRMEEQVERLVGVPSVGTEPGKPRAVAKSAEANKSKQTAQSGKRKRAPKLDKKATQAAASGAPDSSCSKPRDGAQAAGAMVTPIATLPVSEGGCADIAQESSPLLSLSTPVTPSPSQVHGSMPVATDAPAAAGTKTVRFADVCGSETSLVSSMPHDIFADYQPQRRVTLKPVIYQEPSSSEDEGADDGAASSTSRAPKRLKLKINATSSSTVSASTLDDLDSDFSVDNSNSDSSEDSSGTSNGSEAGSSDDDLYELGAAVLPVLNTAAPVEVPKPLGQALSVKRPFTVEEDGCIRTLAGQGTSWASIGRQLGRAPKTVSARYATINASRAPFTPDDDAIILKRREEGASYAKINEELGKSPGRIKHRFLALSSAKVG